MLKPMVLIKVLLEEILLQPFEICQEVQVKFYSTIKLRRNNCGKSYLKQTKINLSWQQVLINKLEFKKKFKVDHKESLSKV